MEGQDNGARARTGNKERGTVTQSVAIQWLNSLPVFPVFAFTGALPVPARATGSFLACFSVLLCFNSNFLVYFQDDLPGQALLDVVFARLNLIETSYFGIRYIDEENQTVSVVRQRAARKGQDSDAGPPLPTHFRWASILVFEIHFRFQ